MSPIKRLKSPLLQAVNRANSLKSTGPQTGPGKARSSLNSVKHGIFARVQVASMKELGEDPAAFEELRESLRQAFCPQDGFEQMLVEDMAEIRWRRQRLMRAEAGILASKKREFSIQREWKGANYGKGSNGEATVIPYPKMGLVSLGPSAENIAEIIDLLEDLKQSVETEGFAKEEFWRIKAVYGEKPSYAGRYLMDLFDRTPEWLKADPVRCSEEVDAFRRRMLKTLTGEIAFFKKLDELHNARDAKVTEALMDGQLMPSQEDLRKIMDYEAALERHFERKVRQLVAWRRFNSGVSPADEL